MNTKFKRLSGRLFKELSQKTFLKSNKLTSIVFKKKYDSLISEEVKESRGDISDFYQKLLSGEIKNIKLIGDSITAGVGSWSYHQTKKTNVIFKDEKGTYREAPSNILSWSNFLREYISVNFPEVTFKNYGIGGKSAKWWNRNKTHLVSDSEDVIFVMLGTNDRGYQASLEEFKEALEEMLKYIEARSNLLYVMSPPPALSDGPYSYGMKETNEAIKEICAKNNFNFLSQYENLVEHSENNDTSLTNLLETNGGSHPIQRGYDQMWIYLKDKLTLT